MKRALALVLLGLVGCATTPKVNERYALSDDLRSTLDAHARAAGLPSLNGAEADELRVWIHGYMTRDIDGYVVSTGGATKCETTYNYENGVVSLDPARCRRWHDIERVLAALDDLIALDGKALSCEVEDGVGVYVEGIRDGRRFVLSADNPALCKDPGARVVANLLDKLPQ